MKLEKWTLGLAAVGLVNLSPALLAQTPTPLVPVQTALSATTISGYVDTSAVWNPGTGNANPAPYAFNAGKQDGFNLDSVDVRIERGLDDAQWSAGYVLELSYGPDALAIDNGAYPIRQAYVTLRTPIGNGIDWQLGRWDSLLGKESSDSYKNPNYTKSYGKTFEPTENTGLLGTYTVNDSIKLQAGVADTVNTLGLNSRTDPGSAVIESKKSALTLLTLTAPDSWGSFKGSAFYAGYDYGEGNSGGVNGVDTSTGHDRQQVYLGLTLFTPVKDLTFGATWDWVHHFDVVVPAGGTYDARYVDSVAGYGSYKITDKLTISGRAEYANGPGLTALLLANDGEVPGTGPGTSSGTFDKVFDVTGTLQYDLWANVVSRLELRWDHACDDSTPFGGTVGGTGAKKNEVMLAANVIYKF
jgi:hypothetical protein